MSLDNEDWKMWDEEEEDLNEEEEPISVQMDDDSDDYDSKTRHQV